VKQVLVNKGRWFGPGDEIRLEPAVFVTTRFLANHPELGRFGPGSILRLGADPAGLNSIDTYVIGVGDVASDDPVAPEILFTRALPDFPVNDVHLLVHASPDRQSAARADILRAFSIASLKPPTIERVDSADELASVIGRQSDTLKGVAAAVLGVNLFAAAAIGLLGATARTKTFAMHRANGASPRGVLGAVWIEGVLVACGAGCAAIVGMYLLVSRAPGIFRLGPASAIELDPVLNLAGLGSTMFVVLVVGAVVGVLPAWKVTRGALHLLVRGE
jgi:predicted lysophospholipase L1 biosynthesis ABC-type transport system permease subunit